MNGFSQGDIIKIGSFRNLFLIVSNNHFIHKTGMFHVCPLLKDQPEGALHIAIEGKNGTRGTVLCEQIKLIDPDARGCTRMDRLSYDQIMNISDALQGMVEYD